MRKLLSVLLLCVGLYACDTLSDQAVRYNDRILTVQAKISTAFTRMDSALSSFEEREMEYAQKILDAEIIKGQRLLDTIGAFNGDSTLLKAARHLFNFYEGAAEEQYPQLMVILGKPDSLYTRADQLEAYRLDSIIRTEFRAAHDTFVSGQQIFWEKYNIVPKEGG